jgi:SAM-dependent methyltransferase
VSEAPLPPGAAFDRDFYLAINEARWAVAAPTLAALPKHRTCLDVGCGVGWFAEKLAAVGLDVRAIDGRTENVEEAARRVPGVTFAQVDIESPEAVSRQEPADLVFCFGLLYHLENPFRAIRHLRDLTKRTLFIETALSPGDAATFQLVSEGQNDTQGLNHHAVIPSRTALLKMLSLAGFASIERFVGDVHHDDFRERPGLIRRREIYLVGDAPTVAPGFEVQPVKPTPKIAYRS